MRDVANRFLLIVCSALALAGCEGYSAWRISDVHDRSLANVRESGYPTRLLVDLNDSISTVAREGREDDSVSTLLVLTRDDALIVPGTRLRKDLSPDDLKKVVDRVKARQAAGDLDGAATQLTDGYIRLVGAREPRAKGDIVRPKPPRGHDTSQIVLAAITTALLLLHAVGLWSARRSPAAASKLRARGAGVRRAALGNGDDQTGGEAVPLRSWIVLLGVLALVATVYGSTLQSPFLWDDRRLIVEQILEAPRSLGSYLFTPFWNSAETGESYRGFFRPLTTLSFVWDATWSGGNPVGFHLTNLVLHLATVAALFAVARRFGANLIPAAAMGLVFGLAPRLTESVSWISGRTDVLAALFGLLAFLVHPFRILSDRPRGAAWSSALFVTLGLCGKEVAFAFFLTIVLDEVADARRRGRPIRASLAAFLPFFVFFAVYAVLRVRGLAGTEEDESSAWRFLASFEAVARYALMIVDFARPVTQIGFLPVRSWPLVAFGLLLTVLVGALVLGGLRRVLRPRPGEPALDVVELMLWLAFIAIAPVLHVVPLAVNVVAADRFLYVPLIGLTLAGAVAWSRASGGVRKRLGIYAALVISISAAGTLVRNRDYESELAFWSDATQTTQLENTLPLNELANVYYRERDSETALGLYMRVARVLRLANTEDRARTQVLGNLASSLSGEGRYDEALGLSNLALEWRRAVPNDLLNLALLYLHVQNFEKARAYCEAALQLYPDYVGARQTLSLIADIEQEGAKVRKLDGGARRAAVAELLARSGARAEAQRVYSELLLGPDAALAEEAAGYLILFGDPEAARLVAKSRPPSAPALQAALAERLAFLALARDNEAVVKKFRAKYDAEELGLERR